MGYDPQEQWEELPPSNYYPVEATEQEQEEAARAEVVQMLRDLADDIETKRYLHVTASHTDIVGVKEGSFTQEITAVGKTLAIQAMKEGHDASPRS